MSLGGRFLSVSWWILGMLFIPNILIAVPLPEPDRQSLSAVGAFYGARAEARATAWRELIAQGKREHWREAEAIRRVNDFFNQLLFIDDIKLWGMVDYWAVPFEFLGVGGGDCEDYSIAKYFSLLELGIAEAKMRMVYVKSLTYQQFHMVVAYYPSPAAEPLILDNIKGTIEPASRRRDLVPVFSFNGTNLWLMKERGQGQLAGKASRLKLWTDLQSRFRTSKQFKRPRIKLDD